MATLQSVINERIPDRRVYYRLVALWVLAEGMLGGVIHAMRLPVSGLIVGSAAVTCICLIAWYYPVRGAILQATFIVAIFKLTLSPQASFPAFIAVFFQGICGEILFKGRRNFAFRCLLLAVLALVESGFQRFLVLTLVYGRELWTVINDLGRELLPRAGALDYSFGIVGFYLFIHLAAGIWLGLFVGKLPRWIEQSGRNRESRMPSAGFSGKSSLKKKSNRLLVVIWAGLLLLMLQSVFYPGKAWLPDNRAVEILLRSLLVIIGWIVVVGPVLNFLLKRWLGAKQSALRNEISAVSRMLPDIRQIIVDAWAASTRYRRLKRISVFVRVAMAEVIASTPPVIIWTGPVHSGKTTRLESWLKEKNAAGILTPKTGGQRQFVDIASGRAFPMNATTEAGDAIIVGKHRFSAAAFNEASRILLESINHCEWLVIDEIGPLELRNGGFAAVLEEVLLRHQGNLVLVVREGLVGAVIEKFGLADYELTGADARHHSSLPNTLIVPRAAE